MTAINHLQGRTGLRSSFIWGWMLFTSPILRRSCEGGCFRFVCLARAAQIAPGLYCLASPSESGQNCSISCHSVDPYHNSHHTRSPVLPSEKCWSWIVNDYHRAEISHTKTQFLMLSIPISAGCFSAGWTEDEASRSHRAQQGAPSMATFSPVTPWCKLLGLESSNSMDGF